MKKLINVLAVFGVVGITALMTGCGGDDDDDRRDQPAQPVFAPESVGNRTVTLTEGAFVRDITFATTGNTFTFFAAGTTNALGTGTYQYTRVANNNAQLILVAPDAQGVAVQVNYNLVFNSAAAGTYTFASSTGETGSGSFSNLRTATPIPDPGNGNGNGNGNGTPGAVPTSLAGRTVDFTVATGGNERLVFATDGTVTSDAVQAPNNVATYTYNLAGTSGPATLTVLFPNSDRYDLTMAFTSDRQGTWSGNQFFDNADHPVPAGSSFTIQN